LNWIILIVFLLGTTVIGELVKRKDEGLDSFFKGGKEIPWWAVTLSLIATKTSVSTFIAVPAFVFSLNGNLTYLQMTIGFALGNVLMVFAAGISTLDSALTALSQTSVMGVGRLVFPSMKTMEEKKIVKLSRLAIIIWGGILALLAYGFSFFQGGGLLALGFKVPGYAYGALIGISFLALMRRGSFPGILTSSVLAILTIVWMHIEGISFFWWFPVGALVVMVVALVSDLFSNSKNPGHK